MRSGPVPLKILVLVSGGGTNLQALIDAQARGELGAGKIAAVLSDRVGVYALERAGAAGIAAITEEPDRRLPKSERRRALSDRILCICREMQIGLIVFSGFLSIMTGGLIAEYSGRMINIHPALLPRYGGPGMYGINVHRAVLASGETESGCTIHLVDGGTDTGQILLQRKVPVLPEDTPELLAERVLAQEHIAIVEGTMMMIKKIGTPA